jgi:tetratricopeptide (TPR) repeat protein
LHTLIVLYHAPTNKFYIRWHHSFDLYYARKATKTLSYRLSLENEWVNETPMNLVTELRLFRTINSPDLPLPIDFTLATKQTITHGIPSVRIISALRKAAEELQGVIAFTSIAPQNAHPRVEIDSDKTVVDLAGLKTVTYHTRNKYPKALVLTHFSSDILIFIAIVLARAGHNSLAASIITQFADRSKVVNNTTVAIELSVYLARAGKVNEALHLSDKVFDTSGPSLASQFLAFAPYIKKGPLAKGETDEVIQFLERRIERFKKLGEKEGVAVAHYNLGRMIGIRSPRQAIHHYRKAAEYDPWYKEREYYWRDFAGVLFLRERYKFAALFYGRALEKGANSETQVLYADALMFAGKYKDAEHAFEDYLRSPAVSNDPWVSEWRLKLHLLKEIRLRLSTDEQARQQSEAVKKLPKAVKSFSNELRPAIEEALNCDALCWPAWADLARVHTSEKRLADAFLPFLAVALNLRTDIESWCHTIVSGLCDPAGDSQALLPDVVMTAYLINGETFVQQVIEFSDRFSDEFPKDDLLKAINEIVSQMPKESPPTELRMLGENAEYKVIQFKNAGLKIPQPKTN